MSDERVVLITGANSGVGYATARRLASSSSPRYHVLMAGRALDKVRAARERLQSELSSSDSLHGRVSELQLDVTDEASIAAAVETVERSHGGELDGLINNAAFLNHDTSVPMKRQLETLLMTNVAGVVLVTAAFTPLLEASGGGGGARRSSPAVIHLSSELASLSMTADPGDAFHHDARWQAYRASKAAVVMLAVTDDNKLRGKGIRVFAADPGFVRSNLRGTAEDRVSGGGKAGDPDVPAGLMQDILEGRRDADVGKFVHPGGVHPW